MKRHLTATFRVFMVLSLPGCTGGGADGAAVLEDTVGDTVIRTFVGAPDPAAVGAVRVLWRSERLESPHTVAYHPGRLLIGDRTRVHILRLEGDSAAGAVTVGREGEGPGEFRDVTAVGFLAPDTLAAYDPRNARLTLLDPDGELLGERRLAVGGGRPPVFWRRRLRAHQGDLLEISSSMFAGEGRGTVSLVRRGLDSAVVVEEWPGHENQVLDGGVITGARLFSDGTIAAIGPTGRVARGDGQDYCITVFTVDAADPPRRFCRDRERTPMGAGIRSPDWSRIDDPETRQGFERLHRAVRMEDRLPSYDRLLWTEDGRLWVRTLGPEVAEAHPFLGQRGPGGVPIARHWDVYDMDGSGGVRTVPLPAGFEPRAVAGDRVHGLYELETGEVVVAMLKLQE